MSAGELFDLIRPAVMVVSAVVSTWVLASARKRFPLHYAAGWAAGTLFLPLIVFPLYVVVLIVWRRPRRLPIEWRFTLPVLYAAVVLAGIGSYFYLDYQSVDAHLARATQAKLVEDRTTAIREYKEALALEDDPHTRKLLAIELGESGYLHEAISEFRLAQQGGEHDDSIHYRLGLLLEQLNLNGQSRLEFQDFLRSETCMQIDPRCESVRHKLEEPIE